MAGKIKRVETRHVLFEQFVDFATKVLKSGDYDPNYLLLAYVFEARRYSLSERLAHCICFLSTSHIRSGEELYRRYTETGRIGDSRTVVTNTQRRAFRGNRKMEIFFDAAIRELTLGRVSDIVESHSPEEAWLRLRALFESVPYGGPYHSFKFCDLLKYTMGQPITSPDIGVGGAGRAAGPIPGLVLLSGRSWEQCAGDLGLQRTYWRRALAAGVPCHGMEEFETTLCDFNKFALGRYYVGENLDWQQTFLEGMSDVYWQGRRSLFPNDMLGELGGWTAPRVERRRRLI